MPPADASFSSKETKLAAKLVSRLKEKPNWKRYASSSYGMPFEPEDIFKPHISMGEVLDLVLQSPTAQPGSLRQESSAIEEEVDVEKAYTPETIPQ